MSKMLKSVASPSQDVRVLGPLASAVPGGEDSYPKECWTGERWRAPATHVSTQGGYFSFWENGVGLPYPPKSQPSTGAIARATQSDIWTEKPATCPPGHWGIGSIGVLVEFIPGVPPCPMPSLCPDQIEQFSYALTARELARLSRPLQLRPWQQLLRSP